MFKSEEMQKLFVFYSQDEERVRTHKIMASQAEKYIPIRAKILSMCN